MGNVSDSFTASIAVDTDGPTGSIAINSGAAATGSTEVTLTLWATDPAGVAQMTFSNDTNNWSSWEDYSASKSWTISGPDGFKTVFVRFMDTLGNASAPFLGVITLDTTTPQVASVAVTPALNAAGDAVRVTVHATDLAGVASVTANGSTLTQTGSDSWSGELAAAPEMGVHTVTITATDAASHTATDTSGSYTTTKVFATAGISLFNSIMVPASEKWLFRFWGKVTIIDANSFTLDDGSKAIITVVAPGYVGLVNGDYVSARGIINPAANPPTLTCPAQTVVKWN